MELNLERILISILVYETNLLLFLEELINIINLIILILLKLSLV